MKRTAAFLLFLFALSVTALGQGRLPIPICEQDGSPCVNNATKIIVSDDTLTRSGNTAIISTGAGSGDGSPVTTSATLVAHWRAEDLTTLSSGDLVTTWTDHVGGYVLTGSGTNRPTYVRYQSGTQQFPALNFTVSPAHYLENTNFQFNKKSGTIIIVKRANAVPSSNVILHFLNAGNTWINELSGAIRYNDNGGGSTDTNIPLTDKPDVTTFVFGASNIVVTRDQFTVTNTVNTTGTLTGFRLGAFTTGNSPYQGDMFELLFFNGPLSTADRNAWVQFLDRKYAQDRLPLVVAHGSSSPAGVLVTTFKNEAGHIAADALNLNLHVVAKSGEAVTGVAGSAQYAATLASKRVAGVRQVITVYLGSNDIAQGVDPTVTHTNYANYCTALRALGWTVGAVTMLPRTGFTTERATFNGLIRTNWPTYADFLVDWASDPNIGDDGDNTDLTYYFSDAVHLNDTGSIVAAPYYIRGYRVGLRRNGNIYYTDTDVSTSGTGEDALTTYNFSRVLSKDGDRLIIQAGFDATAGTGSEKTYRAKINATNIEATGAIQAGAAGSAVMNITIERVNSTTARVIKNTSASGTSLTLSKYQVLTGLDFNSITFTTTGEVTVSGDAAITQKLLTVDFHPL